MKTNPKNQPIVIKLNLLAAKRDPIRALDKELLKKFDKEQLAEIKKESIVVFCDEYHKLPKGMNLYALLKRECPKIKIFAVGVHESLPRVEEDELFCALAPLNDGRPQKDRFLHLKMQPVTEGSLIADLDHYLKTDPKADPKAEPKPKTNPNAPYNKPPKDGVSVAHWNTSSVYMDHVAKVRGLKELLEKPVHLTFLREEFPYLMEAHKKQHGDKALELFELDILEHIIFKRHFPREQVKLTEMITLASAAEDRAALAKKSVNFNVNLEDFQRKFASYLKSKNIVAVDKSELESDACSPELRWFFSPEQEVYLNASLLVEREGQWRFENDLDLEVFSHRDTVAGLKKETLDGQPLKHKNYSEKDLSSEALAMMAVAIKKEPKLLAILEKLVPLTSKAGENSKKAIAEYEAKYCIKIATPTKPEEKEEDIWV